MTMEHPHYPIIYNDPRYQHVGIDLPLGESLEDCQVSVFQAWREIVRDLSQSSNTSKKHESNYS